MLEVEISPKYLAAHTGLLANGEPAGLQLQCISAPGCGSSCTCRWNWRRICASRLHLHGNDGALMSLRGGGGESEWNGMDAGKTRAA